MEKSQTLKDLLKKFKEGDLTLPEVRELAAILEKGEQDPGLRLALDETWQASETDDVEIPTGKMLARLRQQLPSSVPAPGKPVKAPIIRKLLPLMRYAALVVLSAGITWLAKDRSTLRTYVNIPNPVAGASNHISVPFGSKSRVVLPDGSVVNLNSGSSLEYPAGMDSSVRYAVIEGEAFFDISKDPARPFIVKTGDITIKVLGTKFNVKSYRDEKTVETTLVSGKLEIFSDKSTGSGRKRVLIMKPNQQAIFERQSGRIAVTEIPENPEMNPPKPLQRQVNKNVDVATVISWKDNRLLFRDESFSGLARKLERWYDVKIEIQDRELADALFSGIFENETIEQALAALQLATPFHYKMNKNRIIISK